MKHNVTIHMGASRFDVHVRNAAGVPVTFDLYVMEKDARRQFIKTFTKAYRESTK